MNHNRRPSNAIVNQLREVFREDFKEHDYCIGQECVESLFRKLLNEPNPTIKGDPISYENASNIFRAELEKFSSKLNNVFNKDDIFYRKLK